MNDTDLARRFRRWRSATRHCLLLGAALASAAQFLPAGAVSATLRSIMLVSGIALLVATFVLYFRYANRCPRCGRAFSQAPEYQGSETDGLPLFNTIPACPFCHCALEAPDSKPAGS